MEKEAKVQILPGTTIHNMLEKCMDELYDVSLKKADTWFRQAVNVIIYGSTMPLHCYKSLDISKNQDKSCMLYIVFNKKLFNVLLKNRKKEHFWHAGEVFVEIYVFFNNKKYNGILLDKDASNLFCLGKRWSVSKIDGLNYLDTSNVQNMDYMFHHCNLGDIDLSSLCTDQVTSMHGMFEDAGVAKVNLSSFCTKNVTNMKDMFARNEELQEIIWGENFTTSRVTDMSGMFDGCFFTKKLDLSHFDTSEVRNMAYMFCLCTELEELNISNFNTSKVQNMAYMFASAGIEDYNLSSFNTSSVTNMMGMFNRSETGECVMPYSKIPTKLDLSSFDLSNVEEAGLMFEECEGLEYLTLKNPTLKFLEQIKPTLNPNCKIKIIDKKIKQKGE